MAGSANVDPTKSPKEIDYQLTMSDDGQKKSIRGIYEFDGDTLKVCASYDNAIDRPTSFISRPGTVSSLIVFKRQKN